MPPVMIVIELVGRPDREAYNRLGSLMQQTLGWEAQLRAENDTVLALPKGVYTGQTELPLIDLAEILKAQIAADVWPSGATVLVLRSVAWAQSGTV